MKDRPILAGFVGAAIFGAIVLSVLVIRANMPSHGKQPDLPLNNAIQPN